MNQIAARKRIRKGTWNKVKKVIWKTRARGVNNDKKEILRSYEKSGKRQI